MPNFRCTWYFTSSEYQVGWTETWWTTATDAPTADTAVQHYRTTRAALLSDAASIVALRISSVDHARDSYYSTYSFPVVGGIAEATYPIAGVWDALLLRRDTLSYNVLGHMFMHFVPAGIFTGRVYTPTVVSGIGWAAKIAAFNTEIIALSAYLLRKNTAGVITYPSCQYLQPLRRTERRLGRPFDALHGRRLVA